MRRILALWILCFGALAAAQPPAGLSQPEPAPAVGHGDSPRRFSDTWLLHLPGIAGHKWVDDQMTRGLRDAGYDGALQIFDWTGDDPGLSALRAYKRNHAVAQEISDLIATKVRANPGLHVILTAHSGGTGLLVWALEDLPDEVKVDEVILLASALSPDYDLSKALSHVRGKCYSFCSENDVLVLGAGTRMFGTIDGKNTDAAGEFGFVFPPTGDPKQYDKLIQKPYDKSWMRYHNLGDHIGCMLRGFSSHVIGPLIAAVRQGKP